MKMFRWSLDFISNAEPRTVETVRVEAASSEAIAKAIAWRDNPRFTTASHFVTNVRKRRGDGFAGGFGTQKQDLTAPKAPHAEPAPAPSASPTGSLDSLVVSIASEAARRAAAEVKADVNPDSIRAIVAEALKSLPSRTVRVEVQGRPAVTLDEATHPAFDTVLQILETKVDGRRLIPYLMGPAGAGKTHLAEQVARALKLPFATDSFTAGARESIVKGKHAPGIDGSYRFTPSAFTKVYAEGGVYFADELDRADATMSLAFNQAFANGHLTLADGTRVSRHENAYILTGGNTPMRGATRTYAGANAQDGSLRDRLRFIIVDYDAALETRLVEAEMGDAFQRFGSALLNRWHSIRAAAKTAKIEEPVSTRRLLMMAAELRDGSCTNVEQAVTVALAGWSANDLRSVGVSA